MIKKLSILKINIIYFILLFPLQVSACDLKSGRGCKIDDIVNNKILGNLAVIPMFINYICYIVGIYIMLSYLIRVGTGLGDKGGDSVAGSAKAMPFIRTCLVSALFLSLPTFISFGMKTMGLDDGEVQQVFNGTPGNSKY